MTALHELSVSELGVRLRSGELSSLEVTEHFLSRIAALDSRLHSFIEVTTERARRDATAADQDFMSGNDRGPMHGIPYALKDIFATAEIRTTGHSKLFLDNVPRENSSVASRLAIQGGVLLGKTATYELASAGPDFDLPFPPACNPWNTDHIPGGSSSGSAAAVAAGIVPIALGSDTAGSIRGPAGYCGIVGIKPTYGLVSRAGVMPLSFALDHCGPLAFRVEDAAIALSAVAGFDPHDSTSAQEMSRPTAALEQGVEGLRIGVPRHFFTKDWIAAPEMVAALDETLGALERLGARIEDVTLPPYELFSAAGRIIMFAEAYAVHQVAFTKHPQDMGRHLYQRMGVGAFITAADLVQAQRMRRELTLAVEGCLRDVDALVTTCIMGTAPRFDELTRDKAPLVPMQSMPFNLTGHPALAVPTGIAPNGLPLSCQIVGRPFDEATVFRIGAALERERPPVRPPLADI